MNITILGSGTSNGVPVIGCSCDVCSSNDERDKRLRSSIMITAEHTRIIIDTSVEFRLQAVRSQIHSLDAVLYTHTHADHVMGLDDIRPLTKEDPITLYGTARDMRSIRKRFDYAFKRQKAGGGVPRITPVALRNNRLAQIGKLQVLPLEILHGDLKIYAYRIGDFAYVTDCSEIPDKTMKELYGLKVLVLGALRHRPHPTHFSFSQAVDVIEKLSPEKCFITHISHNHSHEEIIQYFETASDKKIEPAFDGLSFQV